MRAEPTTTYDALVVMIVENDYDVREVVTDVLSMRGIRAIGAEHGEDALARLASGTRPGLILLDLTMPVMDGMSFLAIKATNPAIADIPVVIMSAVPTPDDARWVGVMRKPVSLDELLATVDRFR